MAMAMLPPSRIDKQKMIIDLWSDGMQLKDAAAELRADKNVVMRAVRSNGMALQWAARELREDRDIVLEAVRSNPFALQWAGDELKAHDVVVIKAAVGGDGRALYYAHKPARCHKDLRKHAVKVSIGKPWCAALSKRFKVFAMSHQTETLEGGVCLASPDLLRRRGLAVTCGTRFAGFRIG